MNKEEIMELLPNLKEEEVETILKLFNERLEKEKESIESGFDIEKIKEEAILEAEAKMAEREKENAISDTLDKANSKNKKALSALIDFDKVSFEDGKLIGLLEQIEALKQECDYLFNDSETDKPKFTNGLGTFENKLDMSGLSYSERLRLYKEMPELYKKLIR